MSHPSPATRPPPQRPDARGQGGQQGEPAVQRPRQNRGWSRPPVALTVATAPTHGCPEADRGDIQDRLGRVEAALDRQVAHAAFRAAAEPAEYLVGLVGPRPDDGDAAGWDARALNVERFRHHDLGLPYGTPAAPGALEPARRALGNRPADPALAATYDHLQQARTAIRTLLSL